jgi:hypothetical protein
MWPPSPPIASAIAKNDSNPIRIDENSIVSHPRVPNNIHKSADNITTAAQHQQRHGRNNQHEKGHKNNTHTARVRTVVACV